MRSPNPIIPIVEHICLFLALVKINVPARMTVIMKSASTFLDYSPHNCKMTAANATIPAMTFMSLISVLVLLRE